MCTSWQSRKVAPPGLSVLLFFFVCKCCRIDFAQVRRVGQSSDSWSDVSNSHVHCDFKLLRCTENRVAVFFVGRRQASEHLFCCLIVFRFRGRVRVIWLCCFESRLRVACVHAWCWSRHCPCCGEGSVDRNQWKAACIQTPPYVSEQTTSSVMISSVSPTLRSTHHLGQIALQRF